MILNLDGNNYGLWHIRLSFAALAIAVFGINFSIAVGNIGYILALLLTVYKYFITKSKKSSFGSKGNNVFFVLGLEKYFFVYFFVSIIIVLIKRPISPWAALNEDTLFFAALISSFISPNIIAGNRLSWAAAIGACGVSLSAMMGYLLSPEQFKINYWLGPGRSVQHLTIGGTLLIAICLSLGQVACARDKKAFFSWILVLFIQSIGLLLSFARGAWVGFAIALVVCAFFRGKKYLLPPILMLILILSANPSVGEIPVRQHFISIINMKGASERPYLWRAALSMIKDSPILGHGIESFEYIIGDYIEDDYDGILYGHAHNNVLNMWVERGLFGMLSRLGLSLATALVLYKKYKEKRESLGSGPLLGAILAIVGIEVMGLTQHTWGDYELMLFLWLMVGVALGQSKGNFYKAVFLDRDGTLNVENGFCTKPEELILIPGSEKALKNLISKDFKLFLVTNQSGLKRGYLNLETLKEIMLKMKKLLSVDDISIQEIFYCPHIPEDKCFCRKPKKGMLFPWILAEKIDIESSWVVGDRPSDMGLAINMKMKRGFVLTGHGSDHLKNQLIVSSNVIAKDILEFSERA